MKQAIAFSILLLTWHHLYAQKQKAFFEIADKKIFFEMEEKIGVERTVYDTIVSCAGTTLKNYPLGTNTTYAAISPSDFKILHREVFNENRCVWTRITNDVSRRENGNYIEAHLLNDSMYTFKRPKPCFSHDTVMRINPITLEEVMVIKIDSLVTAKYHLGNISKMELSQAISSQLGLAKNGSNLRLKEVGFRVFNNENDKCDWFTIDYRKPPEIESAKQKIQDLTDGSYFTIYQLFFENINGRKIYHEFFDLAIMKIKE